MGRAECQALESSRDAGCVLNDRESENKEENQDSKQQNGIKFWFLKPRYSAGTMQGAGGRETEKIFITFMCLHQISLNVSTA